MPRVTFTTYCERRTKLSQTWQMERSGFLGMRPDEQWILHRYFRLSEPLTPEQVHLKCRSQIDQRQFRKLKEENASLAKSKSSLSFDRNQIRGKSRKHY